MTDIQALEHKFLDKLPLPGHPVARDFEYIHHETTSLIGVFHITSGTIFLLYLMITRTEMDFCEAVRQIIAKAPENEGIFVCYGLNTHKSEMRVKIVAEEYHLENELGKKGKSGILKSQQSRAEFLHTPSHRIRFVYTQKHSSWTNQIEIWFGIINCKLLKRKNYASVEKLKESIQRFIEQYNLTAHPFKWMYAGVPLTV